MIAPLSPREQDRLAQLRDEGQPAEARRAQAILMTYEGRDAGAIAAAIQVSKSTVWRWRRAWQRDRLGLFAPPGDEASSGDLPSATGPDQAPAPIPGVTAPRLPLELRETVGVLPDDPLAEAGRKVLLYHFERMLLHEPGTRLGEDIEALHDMRVATRRMRSAFRLFKFAYTPKAIRPFRDELRAIGGSLGAVRDLDVALDKARRYAGEHHGADLSALLTLWETRRSEARDHLIAELESKRFARFVKHFDRFLRTPAAGAAPQPAPDSPAPREVRHVAPVLIAGHYAQVRAYEPVVAGAPVATLHALRIEFKRLRYTLEFFEEVLGPEAKRVIKEIKRMQDHLGDLHDADVAALEIAALLDEHEAAYSGTPGFARPDLGGVYDYLAAQVQERQRLQDAFPDAWASFLDEGLRRDLALAVAAL